MYTLPPYIGDPIANALKNKDVLFDGVAEYGSPLNVLFPENFGENVAGFQEVLENHDVESRIFFAQKPNKSPVFAKEAAKTSIGVDVASVQELEQALSAGVLAENIEATGPKSRAFLNACLTAGVVINVDADYELKAVLSYARGQGVVVPVVIRLSGFHSDARVIAAKKDRFGIDINQLATTLEEVQPGELVNLRGFSFHINNDSLQERLVAIENILTLLLEYRERGFTCDVLNIGGGFPINLMEDKQSLDNFIIEFKKHIRGEGDVLSFNGNRYGYYFDGQAIKGDFTFQPPYRSDAKERFLDAILSTTLPSFENRSVSTALSELGIELWLEPGQALLDQCGITLMRIIGIKEQAGENIIFVEGNYTNLDADRYELFTDPILLKQDDGSAGGESNGYFIAGNLCLSIDLIMNHKVYLQNPQEGDVLAFINTAPYRMDFVESTPLQNPVAQKMVYQNGSLIPE